MTSDTQNVTPENAENAEEAPKAPLWLIMVVVILGIGIVGMLGLIIMKIIAGDHQKKPEEEQLVSEAVISTPSAPNRAAGQIASPEKNVFVPGSQYAINYDGLVVERPEGAELISSSLSGYEILLRFRTKGGEDLLLIVNRTNGKTQQVKISR